MRKFESVKKWIWLGILLVLALAVTGCNNAQVSGESEKSDDRFSLSTREVLLDIGQSEKIELETNGIDKEELNVSWISFNKAVATVEDGTVTAVAGGEAKVTAVVEYEGKEYSTNCIVTVKSAGKEYSVYKVLYYTQKPDRSGYDVSEETFERLVGSSVELTKQDALKKLPANYKYNESKSILTGTVKESNAGCVLKIYYDVAEVTYSVEYYYESDIELGKYLTKDTKTYTTYAFSKAQLPEDAIKEGFVINESANGNVLAVDSVVEGSKLKVYCDRIRSKVTVDYYSAKETKTYESIYGIGLIGAPADVFTDTAEYKLTTYINGEKVTATAELMKTLTADTKVVFKLDGDGFKSSVKDGKTTLINNSTKKATPSYIMLNGKSDSLYLSATYKTTGSSSNTFGISLSDGKTSREIRFTKQGFAIMKDNTTEGGVLASKSQTNAFTNAGFYTYEEGDVYVWAQNTKTSVSSVISDMLKNKAGGSYKVCWAVYDGILFCSVEGETVLRLPLTCLEPSWKSGTEYEIGFSAFDASAWSDELKISNVKLSLGEEAEALLVTDKEVESDRISLMAYDALSGTYLSATKGGAGYIYNAPVAGDTGITADVEWVDKDNTASAIGITLQMGDESIQYVVEGQNSAVRSQTNHKWQNVRKITAQVLKEAEPFTEEGTTEITAFMKDGYLYILYNGIQAQCINMLSLFPDYTPQSEVAIGICTWDTNRGLAKFSNIAELSKEEIAKIADSNETVKEWGIYSEEFTLDSYDFADAGIVKSTKGTKTLKLLGSSAIWQIEGTMNRTDDTAADLLMGFSISSGDNTTLILGRDAGFEKIITDKETGKAVWEGDFRKYSDYKDAYYSAYAFNTITSNKFFNKNNEETRTQDKIDFKAVLYNDTLYVWFTDVDGNSGLCWRVPLTEEQFGGFEAGSDYEIALYMGSSDTDGSMTDLDVKMGYQVTGQAEFVTDNKGNTYNVADAVETIDANINRWTGFRSKTISGMLAEELDTRELVKTGAYAYLNGSDKDIYLSATYELDSAAKFFGISIKNGEEERLVLYNNKGVSLLQNFSWKWDEIPALNGGELKHNYYNAAQTGYIWVQNYDTDTEANTVYNMVNNLSEAKTHEAAWAITDGVLYGMVDDFVFLRMPVEKLCADWDETTEFEIALAAWAPKDNGDVALTKDIEVSFGEEALAKMVKDKTMESSSVKGFSYEVMHGSYLPNLAGGTFYLYGDETADAQVISTTITNLDTTNKASYGFTVKSGTASAQILVQPNNGKVRILLNHGWGTPLEITSWVDIVNTTRFTEEGVLKVTGVIKNNTLYICYNDEVVGSVDLYKLLFGYKEGDKVALGISARDAKAGMAIYSDVSLKTGAEAVEAITLSDEHEWEIFTSLNNSGAVIMSAAGTNMSADGATGECTPTSGKSGAEYIYGVPTSMPQMLATTITFDDKANGKSSIGITVKSGDATAQLVMQGNNEKVRLMTNYSWADFNITSWMNADAFNAEGICNITTVVKNDTLYILYDNVLGGSVDLYKLLPGYKEGDTVTLGVYTWDIKNGYGSFSNTSFAAGKTVEDMAFSDDYEWEIFTNADGKISASGTNMSGNGGTGVCTPTSGVTGAAYIYGVATSMPQKLTTKLTLGELATTYSSNGITIESGGQSVQFYIEGIKKQIRIINNYSWGTCVRATVPEQVYSDEGVYEITAIVKDDTLYLVYSGTVAYQADLEKLFPGTYESGDDVRLGVCTWDAKTRISEFSEVSFEAGADVTVDETISYDTIEYLVKAMDTTNATVVDGAMGRTSGKTGAPYITIKGASSTWEVSGTYTIDASNTATLASGFRITTDDTTQELTNNMLCVLGKETGIQLLGRRETAKSSYKCEDYITAGNPYAMNSATDIYATYGEKVTIAFKAIIADDILYVWMGEDEDHLEPVWRIPLAENMACTKSDTDCGSTNGTVFIGFDDATEYNFGFYLESGSQKGTYDISSVKTSNIDTTAVAEFEEVYGAYEEAGYTGFAEIYAEYLVRKEEELEF